MTITPEQLDAAMLHGADIGEHHVTITRCDRRNGVPAHWEVLLAPLESNRAWRQVNIPATASVETAIRRAIAAVPSSSIVMRGETFGGVAWLRGRKLETVW